MHRNNQLRNQLVSTLNPDSMYHVAFKHDIQKNPRIQYQDVSREESMKIKTQTTIEDKGGKFLSLVSKPKKVVKKGKNSKKTLLKKSHSVILGGTKQSKNSTNQSERSFQRSRSKSCTNLHQTNQNITPKSQTSIQTPINNILTQKNIPMNMITQPNENNLQLTKIISHKLKMDTIQPHQFFTQRTNFNNYGERNANNVVGGFERRGLLRNVSAGSVDRVYFTMGNNFGENKKQNVEFRKGLNLRVEKPLLTPRFDKKQEKDQRKRRQRAGFIRSASARKASPPQYESTPSSIIQPYKQTTAFSPSQQQQPIFQQSKTSQKPSAKQQQIDQCITKMSLIRKQIDQIQSMIHQRLQSSQMRTKSMMYDSQSSSRMMMRRQQHQQNQQVLFSHRVSMNGQQKCSSSSMTPRKYVNNIYTNDLVNNNSIINLNQNNNNNNNSSQSRLAQSRTTSIVNDLNNLSRSLSMSSKCALMQSRKVDQQRFNIIMGNNVSNNNNVNNNVSNNHFDHSNSNRNNHIMNKNNVLLSQRFVEKQFVGGNDVILIRPASRVIGSVNSSHNHNTNNNINYNNHNHNHNNQQNIHIITGIKNHNIIQTCIGSNNNKQHSINNNVIINRLR